jgi:hypothetical protein
VSSKLNALQVPSSADEQKTAPRRQIGKRKLGLIESAGTMRDPETNRYEVRMRLKPPIDLPPTRVERTVVAEVKMEEARNKKSLF